MTDMAQRVAITTSATLGNEGEHCLPSLGICVSEFLLVSSVFLRSPNIHLSGRDNQETIGSPASGHQSDGEPCKTFEEVVRERHERETISLGYSAFAGPSWTKVAERNVGDQIGYLSECPNCGTGPNEDRVVPGRATNIGGHRGILRAVNCQC